MQKLLPLAIGGLENLYQNRNSMYNLIPGYFTNRLGDNFLQNTSYVFSQLLQAIAEKDKDYLKAILEPKLYEATSQGIDLLESNNISLKYIEDETAQDEQDDEQNQQQPLVQSIFSRAKSGNFEQIHIYKEKGYQCNLDVKGVFGVQIDRTQNNKGKYFLIPKLPSTQRYYYLSSNLSNLLQYQIVVVNVLIKSSKKLAAFDNEGNLIQGSDDPTLEQYHKLRLESYVPNFNWVVTDIDNYLKGNPYFEQEFKKNQNK